MSSSSYKAEYVEYVEATENRRPIKPLTNTCRGYVPIEVMVSKARQRFD